MRRSLVTAFTLIAVIIASTLPVEAVAPTEEAVQMFKAEGRWDEVVAQINAFRESGGCQPEPNTFFTSGRFAQKIAASAQVVETLFVPVILVDFPDFRYTSTSYSTPTGGTQSSPAVGTNQAFDSILFSRKGTPGGNPTGSMTDYFFENSYGKVVITGEVYGWYTVSENYSFYVGNNSGLGGGGATLAFDAVTAAKNAGVDFTTYDNDGNGSVEGVIVVHAGPGAETGAYGIWSHRSNMGPVFLSNNKYASAYTINPEEFGSSVHPIGVYCHEYGHILGLPDLYDTDASHANSEGLGAWSLMASGNYNGGSKSPAHLDPWCKKQLGYINIFDHELLPTTPNLYRARIPKVESEPFVYYMATVSGGAFEYYLIENRQRYGFDIGLPGEGLCIYHIDETQPNNNNPARYKVALVQADGQNALAFGGSRGDGGDPYPGATNNRNWHDHSLPNSKFYDGGLTQFAAWNISNSDSVMYADIDTRWSRPWVLLSGSDSLRFTDPVPGGNGNGIPEAGETISFSFALRNYMRGTYRCVATLSCSNPNIAIQNNGVQLDSYLNPSDPNPVGPASPIKLIIPADWEAKNVGFTLRLDMDSTSVGGDATWNTSFNFTKALGRTQILLVDDDNGKTYETRFISVLNGLELPYSIWNKKAQSNPLPSDLAPYKNVFWFTGNETGGGVIDDIDILSLKSHLNAGGNVCIAGIKAPAQIWAVDSTFMKDYLRCRSGGTTPEDAIVSVYDGVPGNGVSHSLTVGISSAPVTYVNHILTPINGGVPTFTFKDEFGGGNYGNGGVIFSGSYRTVFLSFAPEFLVQASVPVTLKPLDSLLARVLNFFSTGAATGVEEDDNSALPSSFVLQQNYPNPFNPSTTIAYTIPADSPIRPTRTTITIYNLIGQEVATIVDRIEGPGNYTAEWNGTTSGGATASSGIYFYRLTRGALSAAKKMILLK